MRVSKFFWLSTTAALALQMLLPPMAFADFGRITGGSQGNVREYGSPLLVERANALGTLRADVWTAARTGAYYAPATEIVHYAGSRRFISLVEPHRSVIVEPVIMREVQTCPTAMPVIMPHEPVIIAP